MRVVGEAETSFRHSCREAFGLHRSSCRNLVPALVVVPEPILPRQKNRIGGKKNFPFSFTIFHYHSTKRFALSVIFFSFFFAYLFSLTALPFYSSTKPMKPL